MGKNEYQMTTVYNYLGLLDNEQNVNDKKISALAEKYLLKSRKNNANALLLEQLLA